MKKQACETPIFRSQTRSVRGTQKKLKIFENSCPRQLLKLACTGLHLQSFIVWETSYARIANWHSCGYRYGMICAETKGMLVFFSILFFPWWFLTISKHAQTQALRSQTGSVSGTQKKLKIFENSCPRQLLQLACTLISRCVRNIARQKSWDIDLRGNKYADVRRHDRYAWLFFMCGFPGDSWPYPNMHRLKH